MRKLIYQNTFNDADVLIPIGYSLGYSSSDIFTIQTSKSYVELSNENLIIIWTRIKNGAFIYSDLCDLLLNKIDIFELNNLLSELIDCGLLIRSNNDSLSIYDSLENIIPISQGYGLGYISNDSSIFTILQNNTNINIDATDSMLWTLANGYNSYADIINLALCTTNNENNSILKCSLKENLGSSTLTCLANNLIYLL